MVAVGVGTLAGSVVQGNAQKDAAEQQSQSADKSIQIQKEVYDKQKELLDPFLRFGVSQLGGLGQAMNPGIKHNYEQFSSTGSCSIG